MRLQFFLIKFFRFFCFLSGGDPRIVFFGFENPCGGIKTHFNEDFEERACGAGRRVRARETR